MVIKIFNIRSNKCLVGCHWTWYCWRYMKCNYFVECHCKSCMRGRNRNSLWTVWECLCKWDIQWECYQCKCCKRLRKWYTLIKLDPRRTRTCTHHKCQCGAWYRHCSCRDSIVQRSVAWYCCKSRTLLYWSQGPRHRSDMMDDNTCPLRDLRAPPVSWKMNMRCNCPLHLNLHIYSNSIKIKYNHLKFNIYIYIYINLIFDILNLFFELK